MPSRDIVARSGSGVKRPENGRVVLEGIRRKKYDGTVVPQALSDHDRLRDAVHCPMRLASRLAILRVCTLSQPHAHFQLAAIVHTPRLPIQYPLSRRGKGTLRNTKKGVWGSNEPLIKENFNCNYY